MSNASKGKVELLSNASASSDWKIWPGGRGRFDVVAAFGGGNVKLQYKGPDGSTAIDHTTISANGGAEFNLPPCQIKAAVTTATAVYATATHIGE